MSGSNSDWANPFCTRFVRPGVIPYRFPDGKCHLEPICNSLQISRGGLIIGPHGTGKSTLIHALMPILHERYRRVKCIQICDPRSGQRGPAKRVDRKHHAKQCGAAIAAQWSDLGQQDLLVIDGLEQVPRRNRFRMLLTKNRRSPTLLATSHRTHHRMPVLFRTEMNFRLANQLTASVIGAGSVGEGSDPISDLVDNKLSKHNWDQSKNLRDFWFECYDQIQATQLQSMAQPDMLPKNLQRELETTAKTTANQ